jgi:hypothetical protein
MPSPRTSQRPPKRRPSVSLTLRGEGVVPGTVSVRQLAEMLAAAAASFEAQAKELKGKYPDFALTGIGSGSAIYRLTAAEEHNDPEFARVSAALQNSLQADAQVLPFRLRRTLLRLSEAAQGNELTLSFMGDGRSKTLPIPPPSSYLSNSFEESTTLYGQVFGIRRLKSRYEVEFKVDGGSKLELSCVQAVAQSAAKRFNCWARATVVCEWSPSTGKTNWEAKAIDEWEPESELGVFQEIASELSSEGGFDAAKALAELRGGS